ncbi:MAG: type I DNA topoisomerase [Clostridia bacterium]|nr:type I DNA topoisomerase [Clostridia bacterium]
MDLIIVESPSKAKTISKYLKGKYKVDASGGHVRDLPEKTLGVYIKDGFEPTYVVSPDKKETIKKLQEDAKKCGKVYLATDPDREGEAISWHLQTVLDLDPDENSRIEFNEISQKAVQNALQHPRKINMNLVNAQQARRVLDRLVGYKLSPLLSKRIQNGLSGGRVQSVALRLIVDREREIQAFKPEQYWVLTADLQDKFKEYAPFKATCQLKKKGANVTKDVADETEAKANAGTFYVKKVSRSVKTQGAPPPFTTSSLQQDAYNKLGLTSPDTMNVAQHLYEGMEVGGEFMALVTYIRTDSVRVSSEAQAAARSFISTNFGADYVPAKPNYYATKKGAQDAHEAIRPINLDITPAKVKNSLDRKHYNVYKLIYDRFLASQMAPAKYDSMQIEAASGGVAFKASGRAMLFAGYTAAYQDVKSDTDEDEAVGKLLPPLEEGDRLTNLGIRKDEKFTAPPKRYSEASLVKAMEDSGIGRPSTYAQVIKVLTSRKYVSKEGKNMVPTEIAYRITDMLVKYFPDIMDINFTAHMEDDLDKIEDGGVDWKRMICDFYPGFSKEIKNADTAEDVLTDIPCPKCGSPMIRRPGKQGTYLACSNWPTCSCTISENEAEISDVPCPRCGALMVVKTGRYGKFLACPNYPDCKTNLPIDAVRTDEICPDCGGPMYLKHGRYGDYLQCALCSARQPLTPKPGKKDAGGAGSEDAAADASGSVSKAPDRFEGTCPICGKPMRRIRSKSRKIYYGCTGYPGCRFMSWDIPTGQKCPKCGEALVVKGDKVVCSSKTCKYTEAISSELKALLAKNAKEPAPSGSDDN